MPINSYAHVSVLQCKSINRVIFNNLLDEMQTFCFSVCRDSLLGSEPTVSVHLKKEAVTHDDARVSVCSCRLCEAAHEQCRDSAEGETSELEGFNIFYG